MTGQVTVVGDVMLDVSEHGSVSRVSPEAPVVILKNPVAVYALGGAGNTAANVQSLGAAARLVGAIGDDSAGGECERLASQIGVQAALVKAAGYPTTVKRRFLAGGHQIMRLDVEASSVPQLSLDSILGAVIEGMSNASALVISDYGKGAITPEIARRVMGALGRRPVVIDTKRTEVSCFRGATVIAPNHLEAERITGEADPRRAAEIIYQLTGGAVLITLGADGMLLLEDEAFTHIASEAVEVSDVTGAGDTVTAALAVALAEGASVLEAARWANSAAAMAVAHAGTYVVPRSSTRAIR